MRSGVEVADGSGLASMVGGRRPFAVDSKIIIFFEDVISSSRKMSSSISDLSSDTTRLPESLSLLMVKRVSLPFCLQSGSMTQSLASSFVFWYLVRPDLWDLV